MRSSITNFLLQFAGEAEDKTKKFRSFSAEKDYPNYAIIAHALKGTAKMIGAEALSEHARQLELAAKESRGDFVSENNEAMIEEYNKLADVIFAHLGKKGGRS